MPVRLSELRTLIADTVRVQRVQELLQGAGRANQDALTSQFQNVMQERRSVIRETSLTERPRIDEKDRRPGRQRGEQPGGAREEGQQTVEELPEPSAGSEGLGGIIDLHG